MYRMLQYRLKNRLQLLFAALIYIQSSPICTLSRLIAQQHGESFEQRRAFVAARDPSDFAHFHQSEERSREISLKNARPPSYEIPPGWGVGTPGAVVPLRCNISRDPGPRIYVSAKRLLPIPLFLGQPPPSLFLFRSIVIMETIILRSPSLRRFFVLTSTPSPVSLSLSLPFHSSSLSVHLPKLGP